jgi:hypothetical protein
LHEGNSSLLNKVPDPIKGEMITKKCKLLNIGWDHLKIFSKTTGPKKLMQIFTEVS